MLVKEKDLDIPAAEREPLHSRGLVAVAGVSMSVELVSTQQEGKIL